MAERRMICREVNDSDAFYELTNDAKLLYFELTLAADDDGFVNQVNRIAKLYDIPTAAIEELTSSGFLISFPSKVSVLTHWKISNYVQKDRYHQTNCQDELKLIQLDENKVYKLITDCVQHTDTTCIQPVCKMEAELVKSSQDQERKEKVSQVDQRTDDDGTIENLFQNAGIDINPATMKKAREFVRERGIDVLEERISNCVIQPNFINAQSREGYLVRALENYRKEHLSQEQAAKEAESWNTMI